MSELSEKQLAKGIEALHTCLMQNRQAEFTVLAVWRAIMHAEDEPAPANTVTYNEAQG